MDGDPALTTGHAARGRVTDLTRTGRRVLFRTGFSRSHPPGRRGVGWWPGCYRTVVLSEVIRRLLRSGTESGPPYISQSRSMPNSSLMSLTTSAMSRGTAPRSQLPQLWFVTPTRSAAWTIVMSPACSRTALSLIAKLSAGMTRACLPPVLVPGASPVVMVMPMSMTGSKDFGNDNILCHGQDPSHPNGWDCGVAKESLEGPNL